MKKLTFLMLLFSSSLILSQNTNTSQSEPTKCFSETQINEIYKGLKQNIQLKKLLNSAQETIDNSNILISSQKGMISKMDEESKAKSEVIENLNKYNIEAKNLCDIQKESLKSDIDLLKKQSKKDNRKALWKGIKIGGITVGVLGTAAALFLISK